MDLGTPTEFSESVRLASPFGISRKIHSLVMKLQGKQWAFWSLTQSTLCLVTQSCPTLCDPMGCSPLGSSVHGDFVGKNTGMGYHALLQGIFPTQGLNPGLPHGRFFTD